MSPRQAVSGMTAIEALIATGIFAVVIAMCFGILHWTSQSFSQQIREATLVDKGEKTLKAITDDLQDGTQIATDNVTVGGNTYFSAKIYFKVPLKFKSPTYPDTTSNRMGYATLVKVLQGSDIVLDSFGNPINAPMFPGEDFFFQLQNSYGWRDNARMVPNPEDQDLTQLNWNGRDANGYKLLPLQGPGLKVDGTNSSALPAGMNPVTVGGRQATPDGWISYQFVPNTNITVGKYGQNGIFSEAAEGIDIDGDGQMTSTYALGYIERSIRIGSTASSSVPVDATRVAIGDSCILQPVGQSGASASPTVLKTNNIFTSDDPAKNTRIDVCIWILSMDAQGQPHIMRCTTTNFLRNNATYVLSPGASATGTN